MNYKEVSEPPEAGRPRGGASVELYRSVNRRYSWRVVVMAEDDSAEALRAAKALALELEDEIFAEMGERYMRRQSKHGSG